MFSLDKAEYQDGIRIKRPVNSAAEEIYPNTVSGCNDNSEISGSNSDLSSYFNYECSEPEQTAEEDSEPVLNSNSTSTSIPKAKVKVKVKAGSSSARQTDQLYCRYCGKLVYSDAVVCVHCGRQLSALAGMDGRSSNLPVNVYGNKETQSVQSVQSMVSYTSLPQVPATAMMKFSFLSYRKIKRLRHQITQTLLNLNQTGFAVTHASNLKRKNLMIASIGGFLGLGGIQRFMSGDYLLGTLGFFFTPLGFVMSVHDIIALSCMRYKDSSGQYVCMNNPEYYKSESGRALIEQTYSTVKEGLENLLVSLDNPNLTIVEFNQIQQKFQSLRGFGSLQNY